MNDITDESFYIPGVEYNTIYDRPTQGCWTVDYRQDYEDMMSELIALETGELNQYVDRVIQSISKSIDEEMMSLFGAGAVSREATMRVVCPEAVDSITINLDEAFFVGIGAKGKEHTDYERAMSIVGK